MRFSLKRLTPIFFIAACLLANAASAQEAVANDPRYEGAISEAVAEFSAGHWAEARALFTEAHRLNPNARTLRGLGMTAFELRNYVEARQMLTQALSSDANPLTDDLRQKTQALLDRTNAFVGLYRVEAPAGTMVAVDTQPAQFDSEGHLVMNSGKHTLDVILPGGERQSRKVDVRGGEVGTLVFEPGAGEVATPEEAAAASQTPSTGPVMAVQSSGPGIGPWLVMGGGGVLIAASVVTGILALNAQGDLKDKCKDNFCNDADLKSTRDRANTMKVTTDVLWITGAVAAGVGLTWLILGSDSESDSAANSPSLQLAAGPTSMTLKGQF